MTELETTIESVSTETSEPEILTEPTRGSRWILAGLMFFMLLPVQIIIGIPLILIAMVFVLDGDFTMANINASMLNMATAEWAIWLSLFAAALSGVLTLFLAYFWPKISKPRGFSFQLKSWFSLNKPVGPIKLWMVPFMTILAMVASGIGISTLSEDAEVAIQMLLFQTPALQIVSTLIVSTVVPFAEELTFRGALYNALLGDEKRRETNPRPHLIPFIITSVAFGLVHLLAGFETIGAIVQVLILSMYITWLRVRTNSVWPGIVAHAVWNFSAAILMVLAEYIPV